MMMNPTQAKSIAMTQQTLTSDEASDGHWELPAEIGDLGDHLEDLRWALIKSIAVIFTAFFLCFFLHKPLLQWIETPFEASKPLETFKIIQQTETEITVERVGPSLMILGPLEGISIALKISLWGGIALAAPFWAYFLVQFALPGLHSHERNILIPFALLSIIAMGLGALFGYTVVLPLSNAFLMQFNQPLGINFWSLEQALDYTIVLVLANMIAFELMAILFLLTHYGWISSEQLRSQRKKAIVIALTLGAILTPPDVLTQVLLAAPLIACYELAILYAKKSQLRNHV